MTNRTIFLWCLALTLLAPASAAGQDAESDDRPQTALEQTLTEHVCRATPSSTADDLDEPCIHGQLRALRSEFGYDLGRLSPAERSRLDATCSRLRKPENLDPYLNCLTAWIVALRESRPHDTAPAQSELFGVVSAYTRPAAPPPSRHLTSVFLSVMGGMLAGAAIVVGAVRLKKQMVRVEPTCQRCGAVLAAAGSLCPACRHEMGVAAKQAIKDRAAEKAAEEERQKREREEAEERQRLASEQAAQQERLEAARWSAEREARMRDLTPSRAPEAAPIGADDNDDVEADPFKLLGVSREATPEEIEAAYRAGTAKYDEALVAHLGDSVRAHYKAKTDAIEQAYKTLIAPS